MKNPAKRSSKRTLKKRGLRSLGDGRKVGVKTRRAKRKLRSLGDARPVRP
jgi:hypothetical protein